MISQKIYLLSLFVTFASNGGATAQSPPVNGMRPSDVRWDAIEHATVFTSPLIKIDDATILMRNGWIEAVGPTVNISIPAGATIHNGRGKTVMAGFIEPALILNSAALAKKVAGDAGAHWNSNVTPQVSTKDLPPISAEVSQELRALGFTIAAAYPNSGIFRGSGAVVLLGMEPNGKRTIGGDAGQFVSFGRSPPDARSENDDEDMWRAPTYPNSTMGAVALLRQTFLDARWRAKSVEVWNAHPTGNDPPVAAAALDAFARAISGNDRVLFDAATELDALRAGGLAQEFKLNASILGGGGEFRNLNEIAAMKLPIIVPFDFPEPPDLSSPRSSESISLRDLESWAVAPSNAARLIAAGVSVSLTTSRLKQRDSFPARAREAREAGLSEAQLIAALTTAPASLLGMSDTLGTIEKGRMANLTVSDGPLFAEDSRITEVWIAGRSYDAAAQDKTPFENDFVGAGRFSLTLLDGSARIVVIDAKKRTIVLEATAADATKTSTSASNVSLDRLRGGFVVDGEALGMAGPLRCTLRADGDRLTIEALTASGISTLFSAIPAQAEAVKVVSDEKSADKSTEKPPANPLVKPPTRPDVPLTFPFGDFGYSAIPTKENVIFRGATVWTSTPAGILEDTDVIIRNGIIVQIGKNLPVPSDARVVDCAGRHLTPGLIDCHSHTGIDGGVNEWTQACTSEVRVNDVIDPSDVGWYRELAGGLTCANQLHGSSNPIGGQNSVVKLKWGSPGAEWPVSAAKPGIKFALGENVVRPNGRYPQTRMGVEAFLRDQFRAAVEYRAAQKEFATRVDSASHIPPRIDLDLEALAEIVEGKRIIHCHSYRQDEILMLIRLADDFGFRIGTFQHILEGYKVADAIARHGAGGSCFSDWWAYKMEVMDAIPWDGAMMRGQGVLMSFNSDSNELARHLNTEAAKAVKYGNLPPTNALEFVTINPAKQLGIGDRTGSIEQGKDADLVLWSGDPLSPFALCEQTWVEGTKRFDRIDDLAARAPRETLRQQLIVSAAQLKGKPDEKTEMKDTDKKPNEQSDSDASKPHPTRLRESMLGSRDTYLMDLWRRGVDSRSARPAGDCGCGDISR